jgi:hypothetical protein
VIWGPAAAALLAGALLVAVVLVGALLAVAAELPATAAGLDAEALADDGPLAVFAFPEEQPAATRVTKHAAATACVERRMRISTPGRCGAPGGLVRSNEPMKRRGGDDNSRDVHTELVSPIG